MKILVAGAGPTGLMFAYTVGDEHEVTMLDTASASERPGHGITFAKAVAESLQLPNVAIDPMATISLEERELHRQEFAPPRGGVARRDLIDLLRDACAERGVSMEFEVAVDEALRRAGDFDLVVAADGAGSRIRQAIFESVGARVSAHETKYMWLSTEASFDSIRLVGRRSELGGFLLWTYPHEASASTVIVQCSEATLAKLSASYSDTEQIRFLSALFEAELRGVPIGLAGAGKWGNFRCVETERCHHGNVVLLGDALHTTHFSMGMGTVLALEDAVELSQALDDHPASLEGALKAYGERRLPEVRAIQRMASHTMSTLDLAIAALDAGDLIAAEGHLRRCADYSSLR